jgi:hypothetical protein
MERRFCLSVTCRKMANYSYNTLSGLVAAAVLVPCSEEGSGKPNRTRGSISIRRRSREGHSPLQGAQCLLSAIRMVGEEILQLTAVRLGAQRTWNAGAEASAMCHTRTSLRWSA